MSPEQIKGEQVDTRTDIFAFGCVVYEMLSGRRAFQRTSSMETMAAILKEEPPELGDISGRIPVSLERILLRCLEKEPGEALSVCQGFELCAGKCECERWASTRPAYVSWFKSLACSKYCLDFDCNCGRGSWRAGILYREASAALPAD